MKQRQTIMLTYDRLHPVQVDLGLISLQQLYASRCLNEQFVRWVPERFVMQVDFEPRNITAKNTAIHTAIKALYLTIPQSKIANLQVWVDGEEEPTETLKTLQPC